MDNTLENLRILVVLPLYGGSLPVGRFCVSALREMGHIVEVFDAPAFHPTYQSLDTLRVTSDRMEYLQNSYLQFVSQAVAAKVETFEPDLVLALAQAPMTHQTLKRLQRDKVVTAMWFVEDFRLFTYWQSYAPFYDVFAVIQKEPFFEQLAEIGVQSPLYLPLAAHPPFHRPLELSGVEQRKYGSDVSFMGAGYPNRRLAFREMAGLDFKIWGTEWEGDHVLEPYVQLKGARVTSEECVKIFNATKVNLNLHSSVQVEELVGKGDFINPRTFEVAACGAFQLVDERSLMPEAFAPDELATFTNIAELKEMVSHFLVNPEERRAVAQKGRKRVLADHTYTARMHTLLDFTFSKFKTGRPRREDKNLFPEDYPEDLKQDVGALVAELGLPGDVAFKDLVWALRQRQGVLSDLETAILFLDEWRKQYGVAR